jgi:hypothetical protein
LRLTLIVGGATFFGVGWIVQSVTVMSIGVGALIIAFWDWIPFT